MFDRIAPRYDLLNHLLSARRDVAWRKRMARHLPDGSGLMLLDLATGTGDQIFSILESTDRVKNAVGLDLSERMLEIGRGKIHGRNVELKNGDATAIPLVDNKFDVVTISFGIRNVIDVPGALREMRRVLKPGGRTLILECSLPRWRLLRGLYLFYLRHVLPRFGGWISGDAEAYRYLNVTIESFPKGEAFCDLMRSAGFKNVRAFPLSLGVAAIYQGDK